MKPREDPELCAPVQWTEAERRAWAPPREQTVSDWADEHRVLSRLTSAEPGPWRTARTPYLREIMDAFGRRDVEQITLCKSTQVGGTEAFHNALAWHVDQNPVPIVVVMPRDSDVEQVFVRRFRPMFQESARLRRHLTGDRGDWKDDEIGFERCVLYGRASRSPAALASVAGGLLIGDEADKWPGYSGQESGPWQLAKERTRTFPWRKIAIVSTPVLEEGLIWTEFLTGDQRQYHVPCPHCSEYDVLSFENVRWPEELEARPKEIRRSGAAWYECPACGERSEDVHKREQLARGVWVPKGAKLEVDGSKTTVHVPDDLASDHWSYHLWAGYSPWLRWAEIAAEWMHAQGDEAKEQHFQNSWRGLPWTSRVESPTVDGVAARALPYLRGELPPDADAQVVTMGVDVQKVELPYVVRAWGFGGESWLIRAGAARSWDSLEDLILGEWTDRKMRVRICAMDYRYRSEEVFELARSRSDVVRAIRGVSREGPQLFTTTKLDRHPATGRPLKRSLVVWNVQVDPFRDWLAAAISGDGSPWHIHADVGDVYLAQLSAQEKVVQRRGRSNRALWRLKPGARADHLWDCEVYAKVAAAMLGADRIPAEGAASSQAADRLRERTRLIRERRARRSGQFLADVGAKRS